MIQIILGIGLLLLQPWARVLSVIFSALAILVLLPGLVHFHFVAVFFGALNLAVLLYLLLPQTAASFSRK